MVFVTDAEFILREKGKEGLEQLEQSLKENGYPLQYGKIKTMDFYPIWWRILSLLFIMDFFKFNEEKIREMGASSPKISFILRLFMKHFISIEKTLGQMPKMWQKHYSVGDLKVVQFNEKEKKLVLNLENFNLHPIVCIYLAGYFSKVIEMVVKSPAVCKEKKCSHQGSPYHEFLLTWQ